MDNRYQTKILLKINFKIVYILDNSINKTFSQLFQLFLANKEVIKLMNKQTKEKMEMLFQKQPISFKESIKFFKIRLIHKILQTWIHRRCFRIQDFQTNRIISNRIILIIITYITNLQIIINLNKTTKLIIKPKYLQTANITKLDKTNNFN